MVRVEQVEAGLLMYLPFFSCRASLSVSLHLRLRRGLPLVLPLFSCWASPSVSLRLRLRLHRPLVLPFLSPRASASLQVRLWVDSFAVGLGHDWRERGQGAEGLRIRSAVNLADIPVFCGLPQPVVF